MVRRRKRLLLCSTVAPKRAEALQKPSKTQAFLSCLTPVALYAISAVYFAGVMVRLMLTLTPVVCMLSAVAFSSVFEHYLGDDAKRQSPPAEDSSDEDDRKNAGNLYDKVGSFALDMLFPCSGFLERRAAHVSTSR